MEPQSTASVADGIVPVPGGEDFFTLVRRLSFASSLDVVIAIVTDCTRRLIDADGVSFVLREGDQCFYADEDAIAPLWKGRRFAMPTCISGWCMLNRQTAVIHDIREDPRIPQDAYRPTFVRSLAMAPVRIEDPLAAIGAYWRDAHRIAGWQVTLLESIADAAALAIANVGLRMAEAAQAEARRKAEEAAKAKGQFLAAVSHDIRQPLQALALSVDLLRNLRSPPDPEQIATIVGKMDLSRRALADLVENLLDFSRAEAGVIVPRLVRTSIRRVLDPIASDVTLLAAARGLAVKCDITDAELQTDPALLSRIVRNLIDNAIRYTRTGHVGIRTVATPDTLAIHVSDSGIGMPGESLDGMFEEYRRNTLDGPGLGLGLSIVRRLTDVLGYQLLVRSEVGKGTDFVVRIATAAGRC
jgi:signal transduction histidine kinase